MRQIIYYLPLLVGTLCGFGIAQADDIEFYPQLQNFKKACRLELDGIKNHDKYALLEAGDIFEEVGAENYTFESISCENGELKAPIIQFNEDYCNAVIDNGFEIVGMRNLASMRSRPADVLMAGYTISPGASASFKDYASGHAEILIICEEDAPLSIDLLWDADHSGELDVFSPLPMEVEYNYSLWYYYLDFDPENTLFEIKIENPNQRDVSFVIAMQ